MTDFHELGPGWSPERQLGVPATMAPVRASLRASPITAMYRLDVLACANDAWQFRSARVTSTCLSWTSRSCCSAAAARAGCCSLSTRCRSRSSRYARTSNNRDRLLGSIPLILCPLPVDPRTVRLSNGTVPPSHPRQRASSIASGQSGEAMRAISGSAAARAAGSGTAPPGPGSRSTRPFAISLRGGGTPRILVG